MGGRRAKRRHPGEFTRVEIERRDPTLEHDPEKWIPVFRKDHAPTRNLDHDPIQFDRVMA
jgi:hypothetical protein